MASISRPQLLSKVRKAHIYGRNEEPLRLIALRHVTADDRSNPIEDWSVAKGFDVESAVDSMIHAAEQDAAGLDGVQQYVFHFYFGTSKNPGTRFTCKIEAAFSDDEGEETVRRSEGANGKGLIAQAMRHQEINAKLSIGSASEMIRTLRDIIDTQAEELKSLRDNQRTFLKDVEDNMRERLKLEKERMEMNDDGMLMREGLTVLRSVGIPILQKAMGIPQLPSGSPEPAQLPAAQAEPAKNEPPIQFRDRTLKAVLLQIGSRPEKWLALKSAFDDMPQVLAGLQAIVQSYEGEDQAQAAQ